MPLLDEGDLEAMRARPPETCPKCRATVRRNYCRQCDVFFSDGHQDDCPEMNPDDPWSDNHQGHRTY